MNSTLRNQIPLTPDYAGTILLRLPNWVGDIVMLTPSLVNLRQSFPVASLIGTGKPMAFEVLKSLNILDGFVVHRKKSWSDWLGYIGQIRAYRAEVSILYTNSFSSALEVFLAGIRVRMGYQKDGRSFLLTHALPWTKDPMDLFYADLTRVLGAQIKQKDLFLPADQEGELAWQDLVKKYNILENEILVGINPGAGFGITKRWLVTHFIQLGRMLIQANSNLRFLVFAGPGEEILSKEIVQNLGSKAIDLGTENLGLNRLKAVFSRLKLMVTNDSGLRWFAVAHQVPTVVLFGSSDPSLTQCFLHKTLQLRHKVPCSPCKHRICPTQHECMRDLLPQDVFRSICEWPDSGLLRLCKLPTGGTQSP